MSLDRIKVENAIIFDAKKETGGAKKEAARHTTLRSNRERKVPRVTDIPWMRSTPNSPQLGWTQILGRLRRMSGPQPSAEKFPKPTLEERDTEPGTDQRSDSTDPAVYNSRPPTPRGSQPFEPLIVTPLTQTDDRHSATNGDSGSYRHLTNGFANIDPIACKQKLAEPIIDPPITIMCQCKPTRQPFF